MLHNNALVKFNAFCRYGDASFCEPPPPVPEKHFGDDNQDALYSTIFSRSAASAIAGQGSVENIPYITSPVIGSEEVLNIDYTRGFVNFSICTNIQ